jgi:glycosyltransferase involved in cell wall biosynthesis
MQFHVLSFEGPDAYSRVGGLATRVEGLCESLTGLGFETHLWFVGDPDLPGHEHRGDLHLHRWCQWVSRHHPSGVYDGDYAKQCEYAASLPAYLLREVLLPHLRAGGRGVILAEEWQTAHAVLHLHWLLRYEGLRERVRILWNANNTFGFHLVPWDRLAKAAVITTVSRYMKHRMQELAVEALVIPNGLAPEAFAPPDRAVVAALRSRFRDRTLLAKVARWDPDKRWVETLDAIGEMKRARWRPLLLARGGSEPHGAEVLRAAAARGLRVVDRSWTRPGAPGLLGALEGTERADVVNLRSYLDPDARRALFRGADAVLANSNHEPFGLVGLEAMASGGIACTGCSGEDYAVPGHNAIVLQTGEPRELMALFGRLRAHPEEERALRRAGRATARGFGWSEVVRRALLPRVELAPAGAGEASGPHGAPAARPPVRRVRPPSTRAARGEAPSVASSSDGGPPPPREGSRARSLRPGRRARGPRGAPASGTGRPSPRRRAAARREAPLRARGSPRPRGAWPGRGPRRRARGARRPARRRSRSRPPAA